MLIELSYLKKFIDTGYSVIPVQENKIPALAWKKYQTQQCTKTEVDEWYSKKFTKWGFCTGFNNLEVIDIDLKILSSLKEQNDFWNEFISLLRDNILDFDNKVVIYQTLSGGYHILYKCSKIGGNYKLAKLENYKEAIIETRGIGGYVVIYDKQISKRSYNEIQEISILDRDMIFECSKFFNFVDDKNISKEEKIYKESEKKEVEITPWQDYNEKTSIFDIISSDFEIIKKLKDKTIIRRFGAESPHSGYVYNNSGCMYLFSTGSIYKNETLYSPFSAYTEKYHNGDFSAAAKELYAKGYGSRIVKKPTDLEEKLIIPVIKADFPLDIFPKNLQTYILKCHESLDSSIEYMGGAVLWLLSVIIGNSIKVEVKKGWVESVNLWIALVGKAGVGKTPSINNIIFPLNKINNREIKKYIKESNKFSEYQSLTKEEKERSEEIKQPVKSQFIVNDVTLEALVDLHEENKNSIGIFKDELAGFFKDMNKYRAGSDLEFWLSSWSNKGVSMNRKTAKSSFVESPIIPILGGIQPSILTQFFTEENKDNGFIDRMLIIYPDLEVEKYSELELNEKLLEWYNDVIFEIYSHVKTHLINLNEDLEIESIIANFTDDAKIEWARIYNKITDMQNSNDENEYFKSMLPKQKSYIPRFALLINFLNFAFDGTEYDVISKEAMLSAEKLSDYFILNAKKIKFDAIEKGEMKKIIKKNSDKSLKEQAIEIYKANPNIRKTELAEQLGISRQQLYNYLK
jgi:hypothetical protein